MKTLVKFGAKR